jgi:hypothetical protein
MEKSNIHVVQFHGARVIQTENDKNQKMSQGPELYKLITQLLAFCYHLAVILGRVVDALDNNFQRLFKLTTCKQIQDFTRVKMILLATSD